MDDQRQISDVSASPAEVIKSQESLNELVNRLRIEVENQAKTIGSLAQTLALHESERTQHLKTISTLQADLHCLARHLAAQHMEERFEALRCEVSTELLYLRSLLTSCHPDLSSSVQTSNLSRQASVGNLAQELYHSRRLLWDHISLLREEVLNVYCQIKFHRDETQRRLTERHCNDMCLERMIDSWQIREEALRPQRAMDTSRHRLNVSELQSKLQAVAIAKEKSPKLTGHMTVKIKAIPIASDSEELLSLSQTKGSPAHKVKEDANICARRK